jgi:hypothetical protein
MQSASTRAIALIVERVHAKLHVEQPPAQSEGGAGHVSCEIVEPSRAASRVRLAHLAAEAAKARAVA